MADRVRTPMNPMEPTAPYPTVDSAPPDSQIHQLRSADDPMLTVRQHGNRCVRAARSKFFIYAMNNFEVGRHAAMMARRALRYTA